MVRGRAQVLADRDDVTIDGGEVSHGLDNLGIGLAHADDDRRLGDEPRLRRPGKDRQRPGIRRRRTDCSLSRATVSMLWLKTSGRASKTTCNDASSPLKSETTPPPGNRHTPRIAWTVSAMQRLTVGEIARAIVTTAWVSPIRQLPGTRAGSSGSATAGLQGRCRTARSRAPFAEDHEGRGAVVPALGDVGAAGLLAHGDEVEFAHRSTDLAIGRAGVERHPHPLRLPRLEPHRVLRHPGLGQPPEQPDRRAVGLFGERERRIRLAVSHALSPDRRTRALATGEGSEIGQGTRHATSARSTDRPPPQC